MSEPGEGDSPASGDPWSPVFEALVPRIEERLRSLGAPPEPGWVSRQLELAEGPEGEIALALHRNAAAAGRKADELAAEAAAEFPAPEGIREVRAVGAYLNFAVDPVWLARRTFGLLARSGRRYGGSDGPAETVCVEHTSANPTGPLHVGRIRNSIIGDTLARVLRARGHAVTTQYYVDDVGRQAAMVTWIWARPPSEWPEEIRRAVEGSRLDDASERADVRYGRPYPAVSAYLKTHPEAAAEVGAITEALEAGRSPPRHREIARATLEGMMVSLARIGVTFDEFVWESSFLADGSVARVLEALRSAPHAVREENGALAIDASGRNLPKESDRIVVARANGTSLYVTRDVAYHLQKLARFPRAIDVMGQDHLLHARTLEVLLGEVGETRRPQFVLYQYLTTPDGGGMSTRKGTAVHLDHLLDEATERARAEVRLRWPESPPEAVERISQGVASGAVRYHIARVAPDKAVAFRWEDALSFEGRSGPFVQYAFVRATSLLRKSGSGGPFALDAAQLAALEELALVRAIARWPRIVAYVERTYHVHAIATYAHDLAEAFNRFYQQVPVLKAGAERESRLALVDGARTTLGAVLDLLGVPTLERM